MCGVAIIVTSENIGDMKLYDLSELLPSELLPKEESSKSGDLCALFFQEVVKGMEEVKITVRKAVLVFQRLYPLYTTTDQ